ncbi:MAG TPA: 1-deoxy-D-xylulose-5-phosphate reductoisomerase, partial [Candidatus Dormibacteraeota bacterium]|nr:1-deoxy-D-xylulose-5-phosphate reductoisomerase [Candidatus Dormibacteraeota bacterium]
VDLERFPAVALARRAGERGGVAPAALNAANEVAVAAFLDGRCRFDEIVPLVARAVDTAPDVADPTLDDIVAADARAREESAQTLGAEVRAR